jgi:colicin import membrane protein
MAVDPQAAPLNTPEQVTTEIAEYRPIAAALRDLYTRHAGVIHDVTTTKGMQDCRAARAEIRKCRTSLEDKRREIKAPALERCRLIDADAKRITEALWVIEEPLDRQIKAEESAAEARREAKRRAEMERQASMRRIIENIRALPVSLFGGSTDEFRRAIEECAQRQIVELPAEIQEEATVANQDAMQKLREMLRATEAREAQEARLAAEREAERERQASEDKHLREERQRLEAERRENEARAAEERARMQREAEEAEQRLAEQRLAMERDLAAERARINHEREDRGLAPHSPPGTWPLTRSPAVDAAGFAFTATQAEARPFEPPADAAFLRDLAEAIESDLHDDSNWKGIPNRLRAIADRLEGLQATPGLQNNSEWP